MELKRFRIIFIVACILCVTSPFGTGQDIEPQNLVLPETQPAISQSQVSEVAPANPAPPIPAAVVPAVAPLPVLAPSPVVADPAAPAAPVPEAPVAPVPAAPVAQVPAAPVAPVPAAPVAPVPAVPVAPVPAVPVAPVPAAPVAPVPAAPVAPVPAAPVAPVPAAPVAPVPAAPVAPVPAAPVAPVPAAPVAPVPAAPVAPVPAAPVAPVPAAPVAPVPAAPVAPVPAAPVAPVTAAPAAPVPAAALAVPPLNSVAVSPPPNKVVPTVPLTICRVCSCSATHLANPFVINCKGLELTEIPDYEVYMDVGNSELDNVQINFEDNNLQIASSLQASSVIDEFNFANCGMKAIDPYAFQFLPRLKTLNFSRNQLTRIPMESFNLHGGIPSSLEVLDLSRNDIDSLDKDLFKSTPNLAKLDLHGNPFRSIDSATVVALNGLANLQYLNLGDTALTSLPMGLVNPLKVVNVLDISNNRFDGLPVVLQYAQNLAKIILDGNTMTELDAASFIGLENLEEISISYMPNLKTVYKGTFQLLTKLEVLRMHDNDKLETIEPYSITDDQGHGPHLLQLVDLSKNKLSTLDEELFAGVQVAALNVASNPFICTCKIRWLLPYWVRETNHTDVRCAGPKEMEGLLINEVDFDHVPCPDDTITVYTSGSGSSSLYWTVALLIILFALAMFIVLVLRSKPEWRYSVLRVITPDKRQNGQSSNNDGFEALQEDYIEYQKSEV